MQAAYPCGVSGLVIRTCCQQLCILGCPVHVSATAVSYSCSLPVCRCLWFQVPLVTLVGASNELPESEELDALYDRFLLRKEVKQVSVAGAELG